MNIEDAETITPRSVINSKTISSAIDYFFGRGELSQVVDQTNPLSQLTHERRLSALGPGRPEPQARRLRGARRPHQPLRPHLPDRDAGRHEHRPHLVARRSTRRRRVRLPDDAVPGRARTARCTDEIVLPPRRRGDRRDPRAGRHARSTTDGKIVGDERSSAARTTTSCSSTPTDVQYMDVSPEAARRRLGRRSSRSSSTTTPTARSWARTCSARPCRSSRTEPPLVAHGHGARRRRELRHGRHGRGRRARSRYVDAHARSSSATTSTRSASSSA